MQSVYFAVLKQTDQSRLNWPWGSAFVQHSLPWEFTIMRHSRVCLFLVQLMSQQNHMRICMKNSLIRWLCNKCLTVTPFRKCCPIPSEWDSFINLITCNLKLCFNHLVILKRLPVGTTLYHSFCRWLHPQWSKHRLKEVPLFSILTTLVNK